MERYVALLRGINVGGRHKVPMAELRQLCEEAGLADVRTYVQSGNVVFRSQAAAEPLARDLEGLVEDAFSFRAAVVVRTADAWQAYAAGPPFPDAASERPHLLHLCLSTQPPRQGVVEALQAKAAGGERMALRGDALWIDYASGAGRSRLTPAVLDKAVGSPVTARNWNTVQKLAGMLGQ